MPLVHPKTIVFDHDGDFTLEVDNGVMVVDISIVQKIVFQDHENGIKYSFSKVLTESMD